MPIGETENPWNAVGDAAPFVVPEDAPFIEAFNATLSETSPHLLHLDLPPSPINGFHEAPLVVLEANPFLSEEAVVAHSNPAWRQIELDKLHSDGGSRFNALDDEWADIQSGIWWRKTFRGVHEAGYLYSTLAEKALSVDFHGYFSKRWTCLPVTLPSQYFGFGLVRGAMERGAAIVVMRAAREWRVAVPGLGDYDKLVRGRNPQTSSLSLRNLGEEGFALVSAALGRP